MKITVFRDAMQCGGYVRTFQVVFCVAKSDTNGGRCMIMSMERQWNDTE